MISRKEGLYYQLAQFYEIEPQYCDCPLPPDAPIEEIRLQLTQIRRKIDERIERMVGTLE